MEKKWDESFIINVSGPIANGKTHFCNRLIREIRNKISVKVGYGYYAEPVYRIAEILTGETGIFFLEPDEAKQKRFCIGHKYFTGRELLQKIGTECFRNTLDNFIWVQILLKKAQEFDILVVGDCRFPNERRVGTYSIYLEKYGETFSSDSHESESYHEELRANSDYVLQVDHEKGIYYMDNMPINFEKFACDLMTKLLKKTINGDQYR